VSSSCIERSKEGVKRAVMESKIFLARKKALAAGETVAGIANISLSGMFQGFRM